MTRYLTYTSLALIAAYLMRMASHQFQSEQPIADDEVRISPKKKREPASIPLKKKVELFRPETTTSNRKYSNSLPEPIDPPAEKVQESPVDVEQVYSGGGGFASSSNARSPAASPGRGRSNESKSSLAGTNSGGSTVVGGTDGGLVGGTDGGTDGSTDGSTNGGTAGGTGGGSSSLSCSSDLGGGAFSNPIAVSLTCTSAAEIQYCLSEGACCDPTTSGTVYSSSISIGAQQGNYCLSFYGETDSSAMSTIVQHNYNIDNTLPDLVATQPLIFYQTTELSGMSHIASNDFGQINFGIGQLNLKTNDPGPTGMNLDCDEVVTNYVTFPAPAPSVVLSFMDTSGIAPAFQVDIPLRLDHLGYGENFITSYMVNNNYAAPLYSCSTTKVTLLDFEYFQADIYHGETGTNEVREFAGGFLPYGFFEPEATVFRGPAGESTEDSSGQKLESGLFGVFY